MRKILITVVLVTSLLLLLYFANPDRFSPQPSYQPTAHHESEKPGFHAYTAVEKEAGEDPYAILSNGRSALTQAAFEGDRKRLVRLHNQTRPRNLSRPDSHGDNTLVAAVAGGQLDLAEGLMASGVIVDREAFKRLSRTLTPENTDLLEWWLRYNLPFDDPQILKAIVDPADDSYFRHILSAGYRPTREEAIVMLEEITDGDALFQIYHLYPDLFTPEVARDAFRYMRYESASPKSRLLLEALFPIIRYVEDDYLDLVDILKYLPYDLVMTHPDYSKFGHEHVDDYCDSADESAVVLFDQGVGCDSKYPFGDAVDEYNYALVQRYIDTGTNPKEERLYGKSVMEEALSYASDEKIEMAKLLIDNSAATPDQVSRFYSMIYEFGNQFDHYRPYDDLPLKLATSPQDDLYVLSFSNKEKNYHLIKQDTTGTILWDRVLPQERFFNVLNNPVGLYYDNGKLLLVQNRFLDGRRKTRLSLFSDAGELLQHADVSGVFEAFVMQRDGYALTTSRSNLFFDKALKPLGDIVSNPAAFHPAVPIETAKVHSRHRYFAKDIQKQDFYADRSLILYRPEVKYSSYDPPRLMSRYLALIVSKDGEVSETSLVGGGELTPLDFALSDSHAYIILTGAEQPVIQKRSRDFEIKTFRYLTLDESPFSTTIDSMSCDASGCSLLGRADKKLALIRTVPGTHQQTLTTTEVNYKFSREDSDEELDWQVARDGEQDFVSGSLQMRFKNAQPVAKGDAILLHRTLGLVSGQGGILYAFGSHDGDAAYEALDAEGNLLGHYELDFGYADSRIHEMQQLQDGRLLVIGHIYQYYHFFRTYAALLTPQGEPIWSRVYHDMDSMYGLLTDQENNLFYTIDGAESVAKLSLDDGSQVKQLRTVKGLNRLLRTSEGRIVGIGEDELKYDTGKDDTIKQLFLYCLAADEATFSASIIGEPGDEIVAAAPWEDGLVAAYVKDANGSAHSNAVLARIDANSCQISFDWKP